MPDHIAKNIIISIDFDGVLAHGLNVKLKYAKKWFGVDLSLEQTKEAGFNALMQKLGKPHNYRDLMDPVNERHIMEYEIPKYCIPILKTLYSKEFRFVIITSRNEHDYPYAIAFVEKKFENLIKNIHNTRNEPKTKFVERLKPRIHVDDDIKKLKRLEDCLIELVYYRQPENFHQNLSPADRSRIHEAKNWEEVGVLTEQIKEIHEAICWKNKWENKWSTIAQIWGYYRSLNETELKVLLKEYKSKNSNL